MFSVSLDMQCTHDRERAEDGPVVVLKRNFRIHGRI